MEWVCSLWYILPSEKCPSLFCKKHPSRFVGFRGHLMSNSSSTLHRLSISNYTRKNSRPNFSFSFEHVFLVLVAKISIKRCLRLCFFFFQRKVRLRYKLSLTQGDQLLIETGEIDSFPDWATLTLQK